MERWVSVGNWAASCSQWIVLPTPGVPVMIMFGEVRMIEVGGHQSWDVRYVGLGGSLIFENAVGA